MTRPQRAPKRAKTKATNGPPPRRAGRRVDYETVRKLVLALPEVEEGLCYGTPGMRVAGRFLSRLKEDGDTLVLRLGFEERAALLDAKPSVYYLTDHYLNYPAILVRLSRIGKKELALVLERAWRHAAPERILAAHDARSGPRSKRC